jgi:SIR2-like protein
MSIQWPDSLAHEIAERRCIVVLGAGASAECKSREGDKSPPNWSDLLKEASRVLVDANDRALVTSLVAKDRYLDAAEIVVANANHADYAGFIRRIFVDPHFSHSGVHEEVYKLDPKVVVTTNFDDVYENYCKQGKGVQGFNCCRYYESHALNDVRSTMRVILKAHGCVTDPQRTVLARTQYHAARRDFPEYFNLLDALFVTNTLLFIGCSLVDPDFTLLLQETNIKCPSAHPHYAIVESGQPEPLRRAMQTVYNVDCLEYSAGQHNEVVEGLKDLNDRVAQWRRTHT